MNRELLSIVECEQRTAAKLQSRVDQLLRIVPESRRLPFSGLQHAYNDLDVMLAEAVGPERLVRAINFSIGANFGVAVLGGPFGDIGMKAFAIADHGCEQQEIAASFQLSLQAAGELVARLRFHRQLAVRAILRAKAGEKQPQKMISFGHGRDGALAAAAAGALLNRNGRWDPRDQVNVWTGHLLDELARVGVHRVEEASLPLGEEQIKREGAFARAAHAGDYNEAVARDRQRHIFQVVLARAVDADGVSVG